MGASNAYLTILDLDSPQIEKSSPGVWWALETLSRDRLTATKPTKRNKQVNKKPSNKNVP